jgi:hypothetical protein
MLDSSISPELFFDGIADMRLDHEVYRCTLFTIHVIDGEQRRVEVCRLVCPASELPTIIQQSVVKMTSAARDAVKRRLDDGNGH